jgi:flagellar M-ring protein FliF
VVLLLVTAPAAAASASTGTTSGDRRAAAVQTVLDRVLGPGTSVVVVTDTIRTSSSATATVRWGSGVARSAAASSTVVAGVGAYRSVVQQNLVGGTTTSTVTPRGGLVQQSVSVVVDRAHLGGTTAGTLRRLVTSAAGIVRSRGDRLSLVVTPFAKRVAPVRAAAPGLPALLLPYAVPLLWTFGGVAATVLLAAWAGGRRRAGKAVARS